MDFHVYLLQCSDGSYYAGHTDDLAVRMAQHEAGSVPGYTQSRRPLRMVWSQSFPERQQAFSAERQIKGWSRVKKEALIRGDWEAVSRLSRRLALRDAASPGSAAPQDEREKQIDKSGKGKGSSGSFPIIVLVRPQLGENIGKAARAMLNFGLTDLRLVAPRDGWPNPAAGPAASGADIVLEKARVFDTVAEAVADCPFVYATTVRKRDLVMPVVTPEEAVAEIASYDGPTAILFGAERSGLETGEVQIAQKILTVPVNPDFRSLNLAQAVILVAYEWSKRQAMPIPVRVEAAEPRATQAELEGLIQHLDQELAEAGYFFPPDRAEATRKTIRTILSKAGWSGREVQAMRGMIRTLAHPRRRHIRVSSQRSSS